MTNPPPTVLRVNSQDVNVHFKPVLQGETRLKQLAWLMLNGWHMTNTSFTVQEKSGVNQITLTRKPEARESHFGVIDGALILGFLGAFVGLVFLLAK
jgi:hypothetical protein